MFLPLFLHSCVEEAVRSGTEHRSLKARKEGRKEGPKGNWEKEEGARCSSHLSFLPSRRLTLTTNQRQEKDSEHCSVHSRTFLKPSLGNVYVNNQDGWPQVEKARLCLKRQPEHRVAQPKANQIYHHFKNTKVQTYANSTKSQFFARL